MSYLLGLDIATSAAKAVLLDEQGRAGRRGYGGLPPLCAAPALV